MDISRSRIEPRTTRIATTVARDWEDRLCLLHHATYNSEFSVDDMAPFTHFGTRKAARDRAKMVSSHDGEENSARMISAWLDIRNPIEIGDVPDEHNALHLAEAIRAARPGIVSDEDFSAMFDMEAGPSEEFLQKRLIKAGIDGLFYRNQYEDAGSKSWIIVDASQVIVQRDGPLAGTKDAWEMSEEEFIGPSIISEIFEIYGDEEDYEHLWEDMRDSGASYPVMVQKDGWTVRWLEGWEPEATMGLFRASDGDGEPKGFYMGGHLWVDEDARGAGLSAMMIEAAADVLGRNPTQNNDGMGFSPAGYGAHASAWRAVCDKALKLGKQVHPDFEGTETPEFGM